MTEIVDDAYAGFDMWDTRDMVSAMYAGQVDAVAALEPALGAISKAIDEASARLGLSGRLIYAGAGTSGRLAVLDGTELRPTYGWPQSRLAFCLAGGEAAMMQSVEGAEDDEAAGFSAVNGLGANESDVVISIAASGRTPYTLGALRAGKAAGALCIGMSNNPDRPILSEADIGILCETGSEIIAGSTRMKAGTAQKAVLNILSTGIMTRLGHVYDGLMVDMVASNQKLAARAVDMVCQITGADAAAAKAALNKTDNNIKRAVLIVSGARDDEAAALLRRSSGNLRRALELLAGS